MMKRRGTDSAVLSLGLVGIIALMSIAVFFSQAGILPARATENTISGFAWSDNIGWVSFDCTNNNECAASGGYDYGVQIDPITDYLSGYAWSDNIGWISFNDNGCPPSNTSPCRPRIEAGKLMGWARACAGTASGDCTGADAPGGWDGWISLHCENSNTPCQVNYGVTADPCRQMTGYAWGSDVIGWLSFEGSIPGDGSYQVRGLCPVPPLVAKCKASPNPALVGADVTWDASLTTGGKDPLSYSWSGHPQVAGHTEKSFTVTGGYPSGTYTASLEVTDSSQIPQVATASCDLSVIVGRREVRPKTFP